MMDQLVADQEKQGKELQQIISNYKRDPKERKNTPYYEERLRRLEAAWDAFEHNDNAIRALPDVPLENPYFTSEYYNSIKDIYKKYQQHFNDSLKFLQSQITIEEINVAPTSVSTKGQGLEQPSNTSSTATVKRGEVPTPKQRLSEALPVSSELLKAIRKQRGIAESLRQFLCGIPLDHQPQSKEYYELKIKTIKQYWTQIEGQSHIIWELTDDPSEGSYDISEYAKLEERMQNYMIYLTTKLKESSSASDSFNPPTAGNTMLKLPKLTLPRFDGDYLKWRPFCDLFTEMIHKQPMPNCQKIWYLKTNLSGEAEKLIRHFSLSDENYLAAWKILQERYENPRLLVAALINKLLSKPDCLGETATTAMIKSLHDTTQECLLGLENLGVDTTGWDPLLLHILIKKLDKTSHMLYEQSLPSPRSLQSLQGFLTFLETRFQSLEALGNKGRFSETPQKNRSTVKALASITTTGSGCVSCKRNHRLFACKDFLRLSPSDRLNLVQRNNLCVNCLRSGHAGSQCTLRGCIKCSKKHNTLLHLQSSDTSKTSVPQPGIMPTNSRDPPVTLATLTNKTPRSYVLLSTALVKLVANNGNSVECRAILDSGSQINLISEGVVKKLGISSSPEAITIQGIGHATRQAQRRVNVLLQSRLNGYSSRLEAFVLRSIIAPQPTQVLDTAEWKIPGNIKLADPNFNRPGDIDLLIGAEFFHEILSIGQIRLTADRPTLQNTIFGWIVAGKVNKIPLHTVNCGICTGNEILEQSIQKFWHLEESEVDKPHFTIAERKCENHFNQTVKRDNHGRFIVSLPFLDDPNKLGDSKSIALRRFWAVERRLLKQPDLKQQYIQFMKEYLELGHMEEIDMDTITTPHYFLPHHSVIKPESSTTKLRVVFDASMKTLTNTSLNDILHTGPTIQDSLFAILLRFRIPKFVFTADIQKMYRQIQLQEPDLKYHLILWRSSPNQVLKCYQLRTVTYGTTCAPYLATKCLQKLAKEGTDKYPYGSQSLQKDFYMDDVMTGSNSLATAIELQTQLIALLKEAGFHLRKWCANHAQLLRNIKPEDQEVQLDFTDKAEDSIKTLGLTWLPKSDDFCVRTKWAPRTETTKRTVASDIAHIFDPLGLMAPVVVSAKIMLQQLWQLKLDWDAALPQEFHTRWTKFRDSLHALDKVQFPRQVMASQNTKSLQIHAFSDASEKAYGAAVYFRSINHEGRVIVRLLCAKSRIAPIKRVTLPRLELCAAKLSAELVNNVKTSLRLEDVTTHLWTDSEIVLAWINSSASSFHTFVANRVSCIQELSIAQQWRHVSSKDNPADVLSRGIAPERLATCYLWFHGPLFLSGKEVLWPAPYTKGAPSDVERKRAVLSLTTPKQSVESAHFIYGINHKNSFRRLQRITAYVLRFGRKIKSSNKQLVTGQLLTPEELNAALKIIIKEMQEDEFAEDIKNMKRCKEVRRDSPLSSLAPFLDKDDLLRVGGRLESSSLSYDSKHPLLLPYAHPLTKLLMTTIHNDNLHVGPQTLLAITRQRYWPIKGKTIARSIVQHCVRCARAKPKMLGQMMGNLPAMRVQPARPFIHSGVDFCGPIWVHHKIRGRRPQKGYIAVFCCFTTKAVHFEVVSDLSTEAFIGALRRFIGRRGHCKELHCDNATNFVGTKNQLDELKSSIYSQESEVKITSACNAKGINFNFIPPRAPHFGGLWEAAVKSAKHLLRKTTSSASLTYEELETLMIEIEAILNSRPLTPLSSNPNDLTALTPGHFLIGEPLTAPVDPNSEPMKAGLLTRWKLVSHIKRDFWRRWSLEYLNELQCRLKWKQACQNVQPGTIVVIKEDNTPVMRWPLGRIVQTHKGNDGYVRVADVRTATGVIRRPIHKLSPLPCENDQSANDNNEDSRSHEQPSSSTQEKDNFTAPERRKRSQQKSDGSHKESPDNQPPQGRKRFQASSGSAIVTLLIACLILPVIKGLPVNITQFDQKLGMHFENLGTISLTANDWSLVVYYDLQPYWDEFSAIKNGTKTLKLICDKILEGKFCSPIIAQFEHVYEELRRENELLLSKPLIKRNKRAPLDIVGNLANSLFGVLDSRYAEEMSTTIDNLQGNQDYLLSLLRNQTSIINSTVNLMKRNQISIEQKFQELEFQLTQLNKHINETDERQYKTTRLFTSLSIQMILITSSLQRMQSSIIDVITDAHRERISPLLISPHQLKQEIGIIKGHLSPNLRLPADQDNLLKLYKLMTAQGRLVKNHIIFRLKLPLIILEDFDLFKIVPIPTLMNGTLWVIEPSSDYLAISPHRDRYYPLKYNEISSCATVEEMNVICPLKHPIFHRGADINTCELSYFNHLADLKHCKLKQIQADPIWVKLTEANKWIYAIKENSSTNVVCGDNAFAINLHGSGMLSMQPDCILKGAFTTIQGRQTYPSFARVKARMSHTRFSNTEDLMAELHPDIQKASSAYHSHTKELQIILDQIANQNLAGLPNKVHGHHVHHTVIGYLGLSGTIILAICFCWILRTKLSKCCRRKPKPQPRLRKEHDFSVNV